MPLTVISLAFDPVAHLGDTASVRLETIALAIVLFVALLLAASAAVRSSALGLRLDDLAFMVVGAVPGAIVGGRLGYVLDHIDYYRANPSLILDPTQGALTLTLAVPFGILTGSIVARLLGAPIGRWMHALALPLLFALASGKLIGVLGGSGQGAPSDLSWATAYGGPGPWGTLAADLPSHPSQVYEGVLVGVAVLAMALLGRSRFIRRGNGAALFLALALWAGVRFVVAFTWRDPLAAGPLRMEQALLAGVVAIAIAGLVLRARASGNERTAATPGPAAAEPAGAAAAEPAGPEAAEPAEVDSGYRVLTTTSDEPRNEP